MSNLGVGVMLNMLSSNADSVTAYTSSIGKTITKVEMIDESLRFAFSDGTGLKLSDEGQSCCESRYMRTDDDLAYYAGATLQSVEIRDAPEIEDKYGVHDVQFLVVTTSKGAFTMSTHNEHNGYYGGFYIKAVSL